MLNNDEQAAFETIAHELARTDPALLRRAPTRISSDPYSSTVWWCIAALFGTLASLACGSLSSAAVCGAAATLAATREFHAWRPSGNHPDTDGRG